ncbi:SDR family oxidoreductase [Maribacter sp. 2308TA10-17]|uniref:SDR family oxidoreductase n=1 Tax=Maribacter sp. 2308TA10-17 TaxID=3386276 RepID=UPI0039BD047A
MDIESKNTVVSGASSGLGSAISKALVEHGAIVYGLARNLEKLNTLKKVLGASFIPVQLDISAQEDVNAWLQNTFSHNQLPSILINNAGVGGFGKIDELPTEQWHKMMQVNLNGMYYLTSGVVPLLKQNKQTSHIINIGSILGTVGREEGAAYCTSKFGVQGFSEALFKELRHDRIKVTCINPGSIATDFFKDNGIVANDKMLQTSDIADTMIHILNTPDNMLIDAITIRPLNP